MVCKYFYEGYLFGIFTPRNEVGARLCFYTCVWFCSQGGSGPGRCLLPGRGSGPRGVHGPRGDWSPGVPAPRGSGPRGWVPAPGGCLLRGGAWWRLPPGTATAAGWNAFLFCSACQKNLTDLKKSSKTTIINLFAYQSKENLTNCELSFDQFITIL